MTSQEQSREIFRRALRDMLIGVGLLAVVGAAVGWWLVGAAGLWGALLGAGLALLFSGSTVVSMLLTARSSFEVMAGVVMGAWLVKLVLVVVTFAVLRDVDFFDRRVFGVVLLVGVLGSLALDIRAVLRGRVPYVEAEQPAEQDGGV